MARSGDLALRLFFQPGERQVFEHHLRQLCQWHLDFIGMLAWLIPRLAIAGTVAIATAPAEDIARLPLTLTNTLGRLTILKAILVQVAQRDLHPFRAIRGDNRLFGNQLAQILANGLLHPLIMPQAILEPPAAQLPWQFATALAVCIVLRHITSPVPTGC